jgi:hypothetical protein
MKKNLLLVFFLLAALGTTYGQGRTYYRNNYYGYNNRSNQDNNRYRNDRNDRYRQDDRCGTQDPRGGYSYGPMSDQDFRTLLNHISNLSFDRDKLIQAQQAVRNNIVTSAQVRSLMMEMTFESNKLDLAKFAFPYVYDKGMYFIVNEAFTFSSSRAKLNDYLLAQGY